MTDSIKRTLRDSAFARWIALALISITMFFAYFFVDVVAPLQKMMLANFNWSPEVFGNLGGSEFVLNVFVGFLILSGIILDKMGIRFTLILAGLTMVGGAAIKFSALSFIDPTAVVSIFGIQLPTTAAFSYVGFAIFGVGVEMAGITVSKTIVKWFKGKEMALAMGLEMAVARLGVFAVFRLSPIFANASSENPAEWDAPNAVFMGLAFLCIGLLTFTAYVFIDKKLDKQLGDEAKLAPEDEFRISDLGKIFANPGFIAIAGLCVLFYSAIFPFQKFAADMLSSKMGSSLTEASNLFSFFPIGAMILTPFIGLFLDFKGKGASMMLYGAILLVVSHLIFALVPNEAFTYGIAFGTIVILGTAFSLVPASMWPSLPKIVEERYLGTAYGCVFWVQNIGLMAVPGLIGWSLSKSNPGVAEQIAANVEGAAYNYTVPELIFASFGVAAIILAIILKRVDKRKGYGLELPNKKK
jgi:MFS family permease